MKKSGKVLNIVSGVIYIVVAIAWIIWAALPANFGMINYNFAGVFRVVYILPALLMLVIAGIGMYRLKKGTHKVIDSVVFLALPVVTILIEALVNANAVIGNGDIDITAMGMIFWIYATVARLTVVGGVAAVILAVIKQKKEK